MSWKQFVSSEEYWFTVEGEATLPAVRNPNSRHFLPRSVVVRYRDGKLSEVTVSGPYLDKSGKPLSTKSGFTGYDADDFAGKTDEVPGDEVPGWVRRLMAGLAESRSAAVVQP